MPRVSEDLAYRVTALLRCAAPEALGSVTDIVQRADDEGLADGEVINMLCAKYNVGHDGWPIDPIARKRAKVTRFFESNRIKDPVKREAILRQTKFRKEEEVLRDLYREYGRDELGDPLDPAERVAEALKFVFVRCAPDHLGRVGRYVDRFQELGPTASPAKYVQSVCKDLGVGPDGWPGEPKARRRARLSRFFVTNCPEDLRKVDALMSIDASEAEILSELYSLHGKNEIGEPVKSSSELRAKLRSVFEAASPEKLDAVPTIMAYGERNKMTDDQVMDMVCRDLNVGSDGWPTDPKQRLRARVERFFINNVPTEMHKVERLVGLRANEDEIMRRLHAKYGVDEFGAPVRLGDVAEDLEERIAEFYEERVPEDEVLALTSQAMGYNLPEDALFTLLAERYRHVKPVPNALRQQLRTLFRRVGESDIEHQTRKVMRHKRQDDLSDDTVLQTLADRFGVGTDGWPKKLSDRVHHRLTLFFSHNDPSRLHEVPAIAASIEGAPRTEKKVFDSLIEEYGKDELGTKVDKDATSAGAEGDRPTDATRLAASHRGEASLATGPMDRFESHSELGTRTGAPSFDGDEGSPYRKYQPGMTQVWPPPDLGTADTLYRSAYFQTLLKKYGGTSIDHSVGANDAFSRLAVQYDDPTDCTWTAPHETRAAGSAKPVAPASIASTVPPQGSFGCTSLQKGLLPAAENPVRKMQQVKEAVLKDLRDDRRRAATRVGLAADEMRSRGGHVLGTVALTEELREYGPLSNPAHLRPRSLYMVSIPDASLPTLADFDAARVSRVATAAANYAGQARLREQPAPSWIADEERFDHLYPLAYAARSPAGDTQAQDSCGVRPRAPRNGSCACL
jgi:hypothetical protein